MNVLLVEDCEEDIRFVTACLERNGHVVRVAKTWPEVYPALLSQPYDVVIVDLILRGGGHAVDCLSEPNLVGEVVARAGNARVVLYSCFNGLMHDRLPLELLQRVTLLEKDVDLMDLPTLTEWINGSTTPSPTQSVE